MGGSAFYRGKNTGLGGAKDLLKMGHGLLELVYQHANRAFLINKAIGEIFDSIIIGRGIYFEISLLGAQIRKVGQKSIDIFARLGRRQPDKW